MIWLPNSTFPLVNFRGNDLTSGSVSSRKAPKRVTRRLPSLLRNLYREGSRPQAQKTGSPQMNADVFFAKRREDLMSRRTAADYVSPQERLAVDTTAASHDEIAKLAYAMWEERGGN